jgi:hypothetical protein
LSPREVQANIKKAQEKWDEEQRRLEAEAEEKAKAKAEADARAKAQSIMDDLTLIAMETTENDSKQQAIRRAAEIAEQERRIREGVLSDLYKRADKESHEHVRNTPTIKVEEGDDERTARLIELENQRARRKLDIVDAVTGISGTKEEIAVLHPGKHKIDILMQVIKSETGDPDDDIIILDGDRTGTALYVDYRRKLEQAVEIADIRVRKTGENAEGEGFSKDELLYFMMRTGRKVMQDCKIQRVVHNGDVSKMLREVIEKLLPPTGELVIEREI